MPPASQAEHISATAAELRAIADDDTLTPTRLAFVVRSIQLTRDVGQLDHAATVHCLGCYLMQLVIHLIDSGRSPGLNSLFQRLSELDPESASAIKIKREVDRIYDALLAASFREFGEHEIAMLLREHPAEFWRLYNEGARQFQPRANPATSLDGGR